MRTKEKDRSKADYLPLLALLLGATLGVLLGAELEGWWYSLALSESFENPVQKAVFAEGARNSLKAAFGFGAALVVAVLLEFLRAKIAAKATLKSQSQSPQVE